VKALPGFYCVHLYLVPFFSFGSKTPDSRLEFSPRDTSASSFYPPISYQLILGCLPVFPFEGLLYSIWCCSLASVRVSIKATSTFFRISFSALFLFYPPVLELFVDQLFPLPPPQEIFTLLFPAGPILFSFTSVCL